MELLREYVRAVLREGKRQDVVSALKGATSREAAQQAMASLGLPLLGSGAGRDVYDMGDGTVIKVAFGRNGRSQNSNEATHVPACALAGAPILRPLAADPQGHWLIVSRVEALAPTKADRAVKATVGLPNCDELSYVVDAGRGKFPDDEDLQLLVPVHKRLYGNNEWYRALFDAVEACDMDPAELHSGNWGLDEDGDLVLLDAGG